MTNLSERLRANVATMQSLLHGGKTKAMQDMLEAADALDKKDKCFMNILDRSQMTGLPFEAQMFYAVDQSKEGLNH